MRSLCHCGTCTTCRHREEMRAWRAKRSVKNLTRPMRDHWPEEPRQLQSSFSAWSEAEFYLGSGRPRNGRVEPKHIPY